MNNRVNLGLTLAVAVILQAMSRSSMSSLRNYGELPALSCETSESLMIRLLILALASNL